MLISDLSLTHSLDEPGQLLEWAREAGQIALRHFKKVTPQVKPDQDFVTQGDLEIERFLTEKLRTVYQDHGLISEEGTRVERLSPASDIWVIDPLDGTTAFVHGLVSLP